MLITGIIQPSPTPTPTPTPTSSEPAPTATPTEPATEPTPEPTGTQPTSTTSEPTAPAANTQASETRPAENQVSAMPDAVRQLSVEVSSGRFLETVIAELAAQRKNTAFVEGIAERVLLSKADIIRDASASLRVQANHTRDSVLSLIRE